MAVKLDRWEGTEERSRDEVFAELYESSYPSLVKYCRGLVGDNDPEEIAQEAFLRAWTTWDRYSSSRPFWALVATIARNLCMDHHRHEKVVTAVLGQRGGELSSAPSATPDERLEQDEEFRWASEALSQLCPNHQRLLRLREIDGWSCDDIADAEGTSVEATTAALYRARQRLRDAYNRVAAGALAGAALFPLRGVRRRFGLWAHYSGQVAASSPALAARAGDAVAAVVAIAIVSGGPVVNPLPPTAAADKPAPVVAPHRPSAAAVGPAAALGNRSGASKGATASAATAVDKASALAGSPAAVATAPVSPDDATFTEFTAAPADGNSRDIYASAVADKGCTPSSAATCPVLFHSPDGGATWQQLKGTGFSGGTVLLAPNFPVDTRIFVAGPSALQVSTDGGATFSALAPLGGPAAISPAFATGDPRILLGAVPGWEINDRDKTTTPMHLDPRPPGHVFRFTFSPGYPKDARLLVGAATPSADANELQSATVTVCTGSTCGDPTVLPGGQGLPTVVPSRSFATTGLAFAWAGDHLFKSTNGAGDFKSLALPAKATVQGLAEDPDGTLFLALLATDDKGTPSGGGFYVSHDGGRIWAQLGHDTPLAKGVATVTSLGHNRLLASSAAGGGLLCSVDAGKTWASRCPAS